MLRFKLLILVAVLLMCVSCAISSNSQKEIVHRSEIKAVIGQTKEESAPFTIEMVSIENASLQVDVNYVGGCSAHHFEAIGSPSISKSLPPGRRLKLMHNASEDTCTKIIKETLIIDVSDMIYKKESGSVIMLQLVGWQEPIKFVYP